MSSIENYLKPISEQKWIGSVRDLMKKAGWSEAERTAAESALRIEDLAAGSLLAHKHTSQYLYKINNLLIQINNNQAELIERVARVERMLEGSEEYRFEIWGGE